MTIQEHVMKKVVLIVPTMKEMYPSGAMLLIGTMLKNAGHKVKTLNGSDVISKVKDFAPDIIGITINTFQVKAAKEIMKDIKKQLPKTTVVIGGPHPSVLYKDFSLADVVVIGEGEKTFLEIVSGKPLDKIKGIYYPGCKDVKPRTMEFNLDYIPLPDLNLVKPLNSYLGSSFGKASPSMYIMASRGCPYQCTYCNKSIWGNSVRYRKPELVLDEIEYLCENGVKEVFFQDDTFNLSRDWCEEIMKGIINRGLNKKLYFKAPFRVNRRLVDNSLLKLAKAANFWCIFYGVESGNQMMLNTMRKGITIDEIKRAFKLTHEAGIETVASFMIGNVGETKKTIKDSIKLMKEIRPTHTGFSIAIPFPGTDFRKAIQKRKHLLNVPFEDYTSKSCVVRTDKLSYGDIWWLHKKTNMCAIIYCHGTRKLFLKRFGN